jgi:hypothetical protein
MQLFQPSIKLPLKPYIAQYIRSKYLSYEDAGIKLPAEDEILLSILPSLTEDMTKRYQHPGDSELELLEVIVPVKYDRMVFDRAKVNELSKWITKYFWREAAHYINERLADQSRILFKEDAIREFYEEYQLTESLYPVDHFRRMLSKRGIKGTRAELPAIEPKKKPLSYKLTPQQCMQIVRIRKTKNLSYRAIAKHYNISAMQAQRITNKISAVQS